MVILFARYDSDWLILLDRKRNKLAWDILKSFSVGVDSVRQKQKNFQAPTVAEQMFRDYFSTVLQATDEVSQRQKRIKILDGLLGPLFEKKDINRSFSPEQRRLIWHSATEKNVRNARRF